MAACVLGIDPGLSGALAVVGDAGVVEVVDLPVVEAVVNRRTRRQHAPALAVDLLRRIQQEFQPTVCAIELAQVIPSRRRPAETLEQYAKRAHSGSAANFSKGAGYYTYLTACAAVGLAVAPISPQRWKRAYGLAHDKDASRKAALERFPAAVHWLRRKMDHDRAEAMLLAEFVRRGLAASDAS